MPMLSVMTELEAVNEMLMSIGQAPVNTLNVSGIKDVNIARAELTKVSRRIQSRSWAWNTDENYPIQPDADGVVRVPAGALSVDAMSPADDVVVRRHPDKGLALWNKGTLGWVFPAAVSCKITWGFAFEDLPETARAYVATSAGRKFQSRVIGSPILDRFSEEDELRAYVLLEREERRTRGTNLFRKNPSMARFLQRSY